MEKQNEEIFEKKVAFAIFLADEFRKISLKNFKHEMKTIFILFLNIFD